MNHRQDKRILENLKLDFKRHFFSENEYKKASFWRHFVFIHSKIGNVKMKSIKVMPGDIQLIIKLKWIKMDYWKSIKVMIKSFSE